MVTTRLPPRHGDIIGRNVGSYVIDGLIGEGGMGSVYRATSVWLGKRAAVKVIARQYTEEPEAVERFFREARAVAAVDDPHIIDIYDINQFAEDGLFYILMPFVDGMSLESFCTKEGQLPLETAFVIMVAILHGLDSVHSVGIVHRDIKPHNILVTQRWRRKWFVKIVDFGIAKLLDPKLAADFKKTRTRAILGTAGYMSPEQARAEKNVDGRADIYSAGAVLFRMVTGQPPYEQENLYAMLEKQIQNAPIARPRALRPDLPVIWEDAIMGALQNKPADRIASARELAQQLARGTPNGETLLRILAPQLCADAPVTAADATLTGEVDVSMMRWASRPIRVRRPVVPVSIALVAGLAIGGVALKLLTQEAPRAAPVAAVFPDAGGARVAAAAAPAVPPPVTPDATVAPTPIASPDAQVASAADAGVDAGASVVANAPAPAHAPAPAPKPIAPKPVAPAHPVVAAPASDTTEASAAPKMGTLVVRTKTWATVYVDGQSVGTAPLRVTVAIGPHKILLVNSTNRDNVAITVGAKGDAVLEAKW